MREDQEVIREFLIESHENLSHLDQDLVELENRPRDAALLASIFRTIHTLKRDGHRQLDPSLISLILETVDATRRAVAETGRLPKTC